MLKIAVASAVQLAVFDGVKARLQRRQQGQQRSAWLADHPGATLLLAAMAAGLAVTVVVQPVDVICTRLWNQPGEEKRAMAGARGALCCGVAVQESPCRPDAHPSSSSPPSSCCSRQRRRHSVQQRPGLRRQDDSRRGPFRTVQGSLGARAARGAPHRVDPAAAGTHAASAGPDAAAAAAGRCGSQEGALRRVEQGAALSRTWAALAWCNMGRPPCIEHTLQTHLFSMFDRTAL